MSYDSLIVSGRACLLRDGLAEILSLSASVAVSLANDWADLAARCKSSSGRIIGLLVFPDQRGEDLGFARQLFQRFPQIKFLVVQTGVTAAMARHWLQAGAKGIISGGTNLAEIKQGIESIDQNRRYLGPGVQRELSLAALDNQVEIKCSLTKREHEVLSLIVKEYTTKEIAARLFISRNTAETHRLKIIKKLGVRNTAGLVREALLSGLYVA